MFDSSYLSFRKKSRSSSTASPRRSEGVASPRLPPSTGPTSPRKFYNDPNPSDPNISSSFLYNSLPTTPGSDETKSASRGRPNEVPSTKMSLSVTRRGRSRSLSPGRSQDSVHASTEGDISTELLQAGEAAKVKTNASYCSSSSDFTEEESSSPSPPVSSERAMANVFAATSFEETSTPDKARLKKKGKEREKVNRVKKDQAHQDAAKETELDESSKSPDIFLTQPSRPLLPTLATSNSSNSNRSASEFLEASKSQPLKLKSRAMSDSGPPHEKSKLTQSLGIKKSPRSDEKVQGKEEGKEKGEQEKKKEKDKGKEKKKKSSTTPRRLSVSRARESTSFLMSSRSVRKKKVSRLDLDVTSEETTDEDLESASNNSQDSHDSDDVSGENEKSKDTNNDWIAQLILHTDLMSDTADSTVRPVPGLGGVMHYFLDHSILISISFIASCRYLDDSSSTTRYLTPILGPLVKNLEAMGYLTGENLFGVSVRSPSFFLH